MQLGGPELVVVLVVIGLVFGPSRLPELARSLGEARRGWRWRSSNHPHVLDPAT